MQMTACIKPQYSAPLLIPTGVFRIMIFENVQRYVGGNDIFVSIIDIDEQPILAGLLRGAEGKTRVIGQERIRMGDKVRAVLRIAADFAAVISFVADLPAHAHGHLFWIFDRKMRGEKAVGKQLFTFNLRIGDGK